MERVLQYLDDLDDAIGMLGLIVEQLRRVIVGLFFYLILCLAALVGIGFAVLYPPTALATSTLLLILLLYRSATASASPTSQTA